MTNKLSRGIAAGVLSVALAGAPIFALDAQAATVAKVGTRGPAVKTIENNLNVLGYHVTVDTVYTTATKAAVIKFQKARKIPATGVVDTYTYNRLAAGAQRMREYRNRVIAKVGTRGPAVKTIQANLKVLGYSVSVDGAFGRATKAAVIKYQTAVKIPATGIVNQYTYDRLQATAKARRAALARAGASYPASRLDSRCMTGRALCVDLSSQTMAWLVNGRVVKTFKVQTGSRAYPTDKGSFKVYWKSRHHRSRQFNGAPMPWAMFFNRGEAVHYSSSFGRGAGSHGCVRIGSTSQASWLFANVKVGDKVIVHA